MQFTRILAYAWVFCKFQIIVIYIIGRILFALYLFSKEYGKWYIGILPFGRVYTDRIGAYIPIPVLIAYCLFTVLSILSFDFFICSIWYVINCYCKREFMKIWEEDTRIVNVCSIVPLANYVLYIYHTYKIMCNILEVNKNG